MSIVLSAQQILTENNYTINNIPLVSMEYILNNAIDYVNSLANSSIPSLSGTPGSQTSTLTNKQALPVRMLATLMLKAYLDRGPNIGLGSLHVQTIIADPQYSLYMKLIEQAINRLRGRYFERTI